MTPLRHVVASTAALVAGWLVVAPAEAQSAPPAPTAPRKLPTRAAKFESYRGWVAMTVAWRDVIDRRIRGKLLSGLPTMIVTRGYVFPQGSPQPVALSVQSCRIVFDLWDEVFRIDLRQGGRRRRTVAVNVEGVMRRCTESRRLPIVRVSALPADRYFVGVLVEVNPISRQMLARIKRWVALPKGAGAVGPGDSLFGSFVGLFVTNVPAADQTLSFRTPTFAPATLPEVKPR